MLNPFVADAYTLTSLTASINHMPFVPGRIGQMGLFEESGITTTTVMIENVAGTLGLLSPTPRGGPGQTSDKEKGAARALVVPHFQHDDAVMADEVQGVREFGTQDQVQTVLGRINSRIASRVPYFDATLEYQRIGALKGVITYADGSTLDLFNFFGISQETEIDFDLDNASPAQGAVLKKCHQVTRLISKNLGALPFTGIVGVCGDNFYDDLTVHKEVEQTFLYQEGARLRERVPYSSFEFGRIRFENYRGSVGATSFVNTDKCHFFPVGVPGLYNTWFAPADYMETVNTVGLPRYVKPIPMDNGKGMRLEIQSNPLSICTKPASLILAKRT